MTYINIYQSAQYLNTYRLCIHKNSSDTSHANNTTSRPLHCNQTFIFTASSKRVRFYDL